MTKESQILDWFYNNEARVVPIVWDMNVAKSKLMEMEPVVFHDDIQQEFYELTMQKIADLITMDLAIPIETVYNTIEDKELLIDTLNRNKK